MAWAAGMAASKGIEPTEIAKSWRACLARLHTRRRPSPLNTTLAAFRPDAPMIPPPGCVLAPVR